MSEIRCRELVGAYAVGALEPPEAAMLADHLLTCTRCRHELDEAEQTAAALAAVPPEAFINEPADPNDALMMRTLHAIRLEAATTSQAATPPPQLRSVRGNERPAATPAPDAGFPGWSGRTARSHRARPRASSASAQRRHLAWAGAAAAAVLVLGGGVLLGSNLSDSDDGGKTRTAPVAERTAEATGEPTPTLGEVTYPLESDVTTGGAQLSVMVTEVDGGFLRLDLEGTDLPPGIEVEVTAATSLGDPVVGDRRLKVNGSGVLDDSVNLKPSADGGRLAAVSIRTPAGATLVTAVQ
ncbi:zf-HC2 domain-containing protein [Cryptosporangium aurantiacum]|uniref:Putative zinc-finger n=1 Tax=Cryptosporangium aurantiacum TaxID=134849 RepID=A0A1M7PUD9_9ACTN|nr:zf-HC2 domain-containing protein [Cryptosporangium aurantiacum]SHN21106.1 Putative zinc-finger [Cryptosporangium aurantiacum]